jgi:polysaccharide export outer membrane protein
MKLVAFFACPIVLYLTACSMLPGAGPMASEVAAGGRAGDEILFDVVQVDDRVVATLRAQPKESFHAKFEQGGNPPELKIAVGDRISVTIWESAAGGLFSEASAQQPLPGTRPQTEPLTPETRPPVTEPPGAPVLPFDRLLGAPKPPADTSAPSPGPQSRGNNPETQPLAIEANAATTGRQGATIPDQQVAPGGAISVPYAGRVPAAGRTPTEVQRTIEALLAGKALEPQALVMVKESAGNAVTVTGEVVAGARIALSPGGDRLLQLIAAAGGAKAPVHETFVRLSRDGATATIPLERLVADPAENIYAQPGDALTLVRVPQTFSVFGAAGRNAAITFDAETISLSQALAKSQGLRDDLANPKGVFLFRYEPDRVLHALDQPMATHAQDGVSPIVYRIDLADANSYFMADQFPVRDKDIIFVADAAAAQIYKMISVLNNITGPFVTGLLTCHYAKC